MSTRRERIPARHVASVAALATSILAAPSFAQDTVPTEPEGGLSEIVVTAQRRAENLQDVPIAISAVTSDTLAQSGVNSTISLTQAVPAVQFTRSGPSGLFFVRGVGTTSGAAGEEGANAFYVDNVYMPDLGQTINEFNNIERIEVLKGPQGTLFGRNAFGGLIHIITKEPGETFEAKGEASLANYQTVSGKLYVGGPVADGVSMDLALTGQDQGKGWGQNITTGKDTRKQDFWGARSKIVIRPSESAKIVLAGDYYETTDNTALAWRLDDDFIGAAGQVSPGGQNAAADHPQLTDLRIWGLSLTGEFDLGFATLTSISAVRDSKNTSSIDVDAGQFNLLNIDYTSGSKAFQQEVRLASSDTDLLSWQVGAFYLDAKADNVSLFSGGAFAVNGLSGQFIDADLATKSFAAFGEVTYKLTDSTQVTGGLRWTKDTRDLGGDVSFLPLVGPNTVIPVSSKLKYDEFTYRLALRHEFTPDISAYASLNRGFKAGTYSLQSPTNPPVDPQFINAYEVGIKTELFDRRLRLNIAAFHYDISDYQVRSAALTNGVPGSSVLLNAASVKADGIDVEFEAAPTDNWRVFGGFAWLDSRFSEFGGPGAEQQSPIVYPSPATCPLDLVGTRDPGVLTPGPRTGGLTTCFGDVTGNTTPLSPEFAGSIGTSLTVPVNETGSLRFSTLLSYNSGYPFESDGVLKQDDFALLNASIEYRVTENWGVELWGSNITKTKYYAQRAATPTGAFASLAAPREYGVTVKFDY